MRLTFSGKSFRSIVILAGTFFLAAVSLPCQASPSAAEVYNWGSHQEVSVLLNQVRTQAGVIRNLADTLDIYNREWPEIGWQINASTLIRLCWHVNALDNTLFQLQNTKAGALPWQRKAIKRIAPMVYELTGATDASITQLNENRDHLWASGYPGDTDFIYQKANRIAHTMRNFETYAGEMHSARELRETLGLRASTGS